LHGWLLGDAMGARLLPREQAYAVGLKARKAANNRVEGRRR
jgi:hypothetical protein